MGVPLLQIIIKQWDKGQRTDADVQRRAAMPDRYAIVFPPAVYTLGKSCILDCHGYTRVSNRVKYAKTAKHIILLDRFEIDLKEKQLIYIGDDQPRRELGALQNQWIQSRYQCRYSVRRSGMFFWLYEEVILNAIIAKDYSPNIFLGGEPHIVYDDLEKTDKLNQRKTGE